MIHKNLKFNPQSEGISPESSLNSRLERGTYSMRDETACQHAMAATAGQRWLEWISEASGYQVPRTLGIGLLGHVGRFELD